MSDILLSSVLGMPYSDDVTKLSQIEWITLKSRLKYASDRIAVENMVADEISTIIKKLWFKAYNYGPSSEHWVGNEHISTSDIVQRVTDHELDEIIKHLHSIQRRLAQ